MKITLEELTTMFAMDTRNGWRPMQTAPREHVPVLLKFKEKIEGRPDFNFGRIVFVGSWVGKYGEWGFAAPVGMGGFPDDWMEGWQPLPDPTRVDDVHARMLLMLDQLLAHCPDMECTTCSQIICPSKDPMHFHHDGCPSCDAGDDVESPNVADVDSG